LSDFIPDHEMVDHTADEYVRGDAYAQGGVPLMML
jgi:hypothetical protein